jgi:hypothetical protein
MNAPHAITPLRVSLTDINAIVAAQLGPGRVKGNAQPAVFSRQIAMYLAKHVGGWSTTQIGRFYNGRDHSTVCHAIRKVELLRTSDPRIEALLETLQVAIKDKAAGSIVESTGTTPPQSGARPEWIEQLADAITERLLNRFEENTGMISKRSSLGN